MPTELSSIISQACPRRPNPVMSVQEWTSGVSIRACAPDLFRVVMARTASLTRLSVAIPPLTAVLTIPVPRALVRMSLSPGRAPRFKRI